MYRKAYVFCFLVLTVVGLGGCSSGPSIKESKKADTPARQDSGKGPRKSVGIDRGRCRFQCGWTFSFKRVVSTR